MKTATAIKTFMNRPGNNPNMNYADVKMKELREFKDACTAEEWAQFGKDACKAIGEEFEA